MRIPSPRPARRPSLNPHGSNPTAGLDRGGGGGATRRAAPQPQAAPAALVATAPAAARRLHAAAAAAAAAPRRKHAEQSCRELERIQQWQRCEWRCHP